MVGAHQSVALGVVGRQADCGCELTTMSVLGTVCAEFSDLIMTQTTIHNPDRFMADLR